MSNSASWRELRAQVWDRDPEPVCAYCGKRLHPIRDFTVDHVVALTQGGTDALDNLIAACRRCNSMKCAEPAALCVGALGPVEIVGIGERMKMARTALGLTRTQLARRANIGCVVVSDVERGVYASQPRGTTIRALAAALAVDPHWLRDGTGVMDRGEEG